MRGSIILAIGLALLVSHCKSKSTTSPASSNAGEVAPSSAPSSSALALEPPTQKTVPTTDGTIAIGNLESQLNGAEKELEKRPKDVDAFSRLVELLSTRARFAGKISDLERAAELGEQAVKQSPESGRAYRLRAGTRAALHRFEEALGDLDEASKRGVTNDELEPERASIEHALGQYDDALVIRKKRADESPDIQSLTVLGALLGDMGKNSEAERAFSDALTHYRDVSPFPVSWSLFQHATLLQKSGQTARAKQFFAAAVARLPVYAHAVSHLAQLEPTEDGLRLLQPLADSSDDPEYAAIYSDLSARAGKTDQAAQYRERALARYEELGKKHPAAFADHIARFFLGPGADPKRAADYADKNLALRKTSDAYELSIDALLRDQKTDRACTAADEASKLRYANGSLALISARAFEACGKKDAAEAARQRARAQAILR